MWILPLEIHVHAPGIVVECFLYITLVLMEMNTSFEVVLSPVHRWETRLGEVKQLAYGLMTSQSGTQRFTRQPKSKPVSYHLKSGQAVTLQLCLQLEVLSVLASVLAGPGYFVLMSESMVLIFMQSIQKPSVSFLFKKYWTGFTSYFKEMLFQFLKLISQTWKEAHLLLKELAE